MKSYDTVYFVSYARLPTEIPAFVLYDKLAIGILVEIKTGVIKDVSVTLPSPLARDLVIGYLINKNIINEFNDIIEEITFRHQGEAQKAIIKTIVDLQKKYYMFMEKNRNNK